MYRRQQTAKNIADSKNICQIYLIFCLLVQSEMRTVRHQSPEEHSKVRGNQAWDSYLRPNGALEKRAITMEKEENINPPGNSTEDTFCKISFSQEPEWKCEVQTLGSNLQFWRQSGSQPRTVPLNVKKDSRRPFPVCIRTPE